jgi:hypothetical protein
MLFSCRGDSIYPEAVLDYVPRRGRGVVCGDDAYLFVLQIHTAALEPGKCHTISLSVVRRSEAFHRLGVQDITDFDSD